MNTNEFAKIFTPTNDNLNTIGTYYANQSSNKSYVIIAPTESVHYILCNPNHHTSFEYFKTVTNRNIKYEFFVYNYDLARILISTNDTEDSILKALSSAYWNTSTFPDTISIALKASSVVSPDLTYHLNGIEYVTLNYSNNQAIKRLQEYSMLPVLSQVLYINNVPCSHIEQFYKNYEDKDVIIIKNEDPCPRSCLSTEILIDNDTVWITNRGYISLEQIKDVLNEAGLSNINVKYHESVKSLPINNPILKYNLNKSIYFLKWIDIDNGETDEILTELKRKTSNYFNHVLFIDFNGRHKSIINYAFAYIDISINGDLIEAIKNIYHILHSAMTISNIKTIIFYDAYTYHIHGDSNNLLDVITDMIYKYTGKNIIMIPIKYIPEQYLIKENIIPEDCMECMD